MNRHLLLLFIASVPSVVFSQSSDAVATRKNESTLKNVSFAAPNDSTLLANHKLDSIHNEFISTADSLQKTYEKKISDVNSETKKLTSKIDSMKRLNLPTETYNRDLDDITTRRQKLESEFNANLTALKDKTVKKLDALVLPNEYREPLQEFKSRIERINLKSKLGDIADMKLPDLNISEINGMTELPSLNEANVQGEIPGTPNIQTPGGDIDKVSQHFEGYEEDIKSIAQGDIENIQQLPETIEDQASKIDGMDEIQKQSGVINEHKADLQGFNDPKKAKEKVVEIAKKAAIDHFTGKEDQLKIAMDKLSKYKKKYGSFSSIKNLPKRRPNAMKGKPLVERLVPGVYLQYQQKNFYLVDVNPYLGYKLSGKFTTGIGWNHRYAWVSKNRTWNQRSKIFGPRAYVDFKLGKGFIAHFEGESMNSFVPSVLRGNPDSGQREWVWSSMIGIKKEYKIYKNLKGTALLQYNLFNRFYKAPYVDRLNSRIGFEYTLKRRKKNQQ